MSNEITIIEITSMEPRLNEELSELLIRVVDNGASIGFLPPLSMNDAKSYWQETIQPGVKLCIAMVNGNIVGTVQLHLGMKQNALHRAEVCKLMVHPMYRRHGIARLLMSKIEECAKIEERNLLILDTRSGDPSNPLYQSIGYIEAGRIPNYARSSSGILDDTIFYYKQI